MLNTSKTCLNWLVRYKYDIQKLIEILAAFQISNNIQGVTFEKKNLWSLF